MAYRADIEIAVKGAQELKRLQNEINSTSKLVKSLNDYIENFSGTGIVRSINTLRTAVAGAAAEFNKVALGTEEAVIAARKYVSATNELNAELRERAALLKTINEEERKNRLARAGIRESTQYGGPIGPGPASPIGSLVGQKSPVEERIKRTIAGRKEQLQLEEALLRLEEKSAGQLNRQLQTRKELARAAALEVNTLIAKAAAGPQAAQLLLSAAAPGSPAMGGGARRRITGPVERLGGARTADEAAMALRFAQALQQQVKPLSQIDALYAGIAGEAIKLQKIKALPSTEMLNATARGLQTIESIENRRFTTAQRRAQKLQQIQDYYGDTGMANAGYGAQGPAVPPAGIRRRTGTGAGAGFGNRAGGAISSAIIGGGFPLLFGQGPAAAVGGALGGAAGGILGGGFGFALSIAGTAIGDLITQSETLNKSLASLNSSLSTTGSTSVTTASDIKQLAKDLNITNDEALQLVGTFSQFGSAQTREALASLFGGVGGAATFEAIARAGIDEKEALNSVFELRKYIGNEAATQLALQLDTVGATQTQATLLKLIVERSIQNSVATAKNVQFTDNLLSTWENIVAGVAGALSLAIQFIQKMREGSLLRLPFLDQVANLLGGVKARSGKQIAEERGSNIEKRLRAEIEAARRAVRQETGVLGTQSALQQGMARSDKAAKDAARLAEQKQKQLEAAARLVVVTDTQVKKAAALTKEEKLIADIDQQRMERMTKYETMYKEALSNAEIEYLVAAQLNEITAEKLNYEQALLDIALEQSSALNRTDPLANLQQEINLLAAKLQGKEEEYLRQQEIDALVSQGVQLEDAIAQIDARTQLNNLLQQQLMLEQLVGSIGQGMGNALTGVFDALISRADNFNEVLSNTLASLGRFLMMAGLNALADMGDPAGRGVGILSFLGFGKGFGKRAGGGPVKAGTPFVVGERGPELFVPGTNGGVMSNSDLRSSMGAAPGSAAGTPVLNMSFETSTINGVEYVSRDQLEAAMAVTRRQAARDGANRGMTMTLDRLQQSPSTRRKVGI